MNISGIDHIELYVGDARQTALYLSTAFGFTICGQGGPETGLPGQRSLLLRQGDIQLVLTSGLVVDHPATEYVRRHGDGVACIGIGVDDATAAYRTLVERGAEPVSPPREYGQDDRRAIIAEVAGFSDVTHRLVERHGPPREFLPGAIEVTESQSHGDGKLLRTIDHIAICVPAGGLAPTAQRYADVFGFTQVFTEYIEVGGQGMDSVVVQSPSQEVTFTLIEQDPDRQPGQIDDFLSWHARAGVHHIEFGTDDILAAVSSRTDPWTRRSPNCASSACWWTGTTGVSCCRSSPSRCTSAGRCSWRSSSGGARSPSAVATSRCCTPRSSASCPGSSRDRDARVRADRAGTGAAADRRGRRVLRRARVVPVREAVLGPRGRRAARGERAVLRGGTRPQAARAAAPACLLDPGARRRAAAQRLRPLRERRDRGGAAQAVDRRGGRAAGAGRADPGVPVDPDVQGTDRERAVERRALALRQALLGLVLLGGHADRVHPVPRLRRGHGHDRHGRREQHLGGGRFRGQRQRALRETRPEPAGGGARTQRRAQRRGAEAGSDADPQGAHELPPLPDLPRQRPQPEHEPTQGDLVAPAGRRQRLPRVPTLQRGARDVQPRRTGPQQPGRHTGLRRPRVLPGPLAHTDHRRARSRPCPNMTGEGPTPGSAGSSRRSARRGTTSSATRCTRASTTTTRSPRSWSTTRSPCWTSCHC